MLKKRENNSEMKTYSIVGDLISYLRCPKAYRLIQLGNLIPSRPSQLWYGNFMHGILQELFYLYKNNIPIPPPLRPSCCGLDDIPIKKFQDIDYFEIKDEIVAHCKRECENKRCLYRICYDVISKLSAQKIFARSIPLVQNAIFRVFILLNEFGTDLLSLITAPEVPLKGIRHYNGVPLNPSKFSSFSDYKKEVIYEVKGIVDVLTQFNIKSQISKGIQKRNIIIDILAQNYFPEIFNRKEKTTDEEFIKKIYPEFLRKIEGKYPNGFEIIIDYKGQSRPSYKKSNSDWLKHEWQIRTYKWLREEQQHDIPIIGGILMYINEFAPSNKDLKILIKESQNKSTDIFLCKKEIDSLKGKGSLQKYLGNEYKEFRRNRVIRYIDLTDNEETEKSLEKFDKTVLEIEASLEIEKNYGKMDIWTEDGDETTCRTCDFRYHRIRDGKKIVPRAP